MSEPYIYYQDDSATIWHGDCREALSLLSYGMIATDPPFGIGHQSNYGASWERTQIANDHDTTVRDGVIQTCLGHPMVIFGSWKAPRPKHLKAVLIWDKGPAFGMGDLTFPWKTSFEEIYIIGEGWRHERRDEGVIRGYIQVSWESKGREHPNQKPVSLMTYLLMRHTSTPVLDPFMGSGTTLVAAKQIGKQSIGIEIEEKYCEIAAKRLQQEVLKFEPLPLSPSTPNLWGEDTVK